MIGVAPCNFREFFTEQPLNTDDGPQPFGEIARPFQLERFTALENAVNRIVGLPVDASLPTITKHFWEDPRNCGKTTLQGMVAVFVAYASPNPGTGMVAAVDQDNARYVIDGARLLVRLNPKLSATVRDPVDGKLKPLIQVLQNKIVNTLTGFTIDVMATDTASAFGRNDLLVIIDEFSNIKPNGQPFFEAIYTGTAKRKYCVCILSANAPFRQSWQFPIREAFRTDPRCRFFRHEGPSEWTSPESLADVEGKTTPLNFRRLFLNEIVEGSGDLLTADIVDAAFSAGVPAMTQADRAYGYVAAVDLSTAKDFSAFLVLGRGKSGRYRVAHTQVWKPQPGRKISQEGIKAAIREAYRVFRFKRCVADPWQAEGLCEALRKENIPIFTRNQTGSALVEQCYSVVDTFNNLNIDVPNNEDGKSLRNQLLSAQITQKSYGLRFESPRSAATGHSDLLTCLSMALCESRDVLPLNHGSGSWGGHVSTGGLTNNLGGGAAWTRQTGSSLHAHLALAAARGEIELLPSPYRMITPEQREAGQ